MIKVMFLCTANSCRSQMAEGLARQLGSGLIEAGSAGVIAVAVQPRSIAVMQEIGIDISHHRPKAMDEKLMRTMDYVITLCDRGAAACPALPGTVRRIHWSIKDPVGFIGSEDEIMNDFRRARDEIRERMELLLRSLQRAHARKEIP
ncbi:MAG TPA: arsenate reductase ArsC [Dissulfurispiraceae bacterium]|nr:arsenate reductase ArsC [Dissulfurispiraceae bacterium]